jgi:hypothetical protein
MPNVTAPGGGPAARNIDQFYREAQDKLRWVFSLTLGSAHIQVSAAADAKWMTKLELGPRNSEADFFLDKLMKKIKTTSKSAS